MTSQACKRDWSKIVKGLSKKDKLNKIKELEREVNYLSMVFMGSNNPKEDHPQVYSDLQKARLKLKQLRIELEINDLERISKEFEKLEKLLDKSARLIVSIRGMGKDIFKAKQQQDRFHKIQYHILIAEKVISDKFYPYLNWKMGIKKKIN